MNYARFGIASMADLFGDFVVYRNLIPSDPRLPALTDLGLTDNRLPRKAEPAYGAAVATILKAARALTAPGIEIARLLFIGDTKMNDGSAFENICAAGGWPGWCFIGRDALAEAPQTYVENRMYVANRWSALAEFAAFVRQQGFVFDAGTAVVIDMDKTLVGARGRNDRVIDEARVEGVQRTVAGLLGPNFNQTAFQTAYDELNRPLYHPFTADNQDYLAYICLILGTGLFELNGLLRQIKSGQLKNFDDFIRQVHTRRAELADSGLTPVHDEIWACVQAGDPTPFKAFRYNEYLTTSARFGDIPGVAVEDLLRQRIVITREVYAEALTWKESGALLFALSDKPDEASMPNPAQAQAGMKALHHLITPVVGMS